MAEARGTSGGWIQQNYDKLLLVVTQVALLGSAVFLNVKVHYESKDVNDAEWPPPSREKTAERVDLNSYVEKNVLLENPFAGVEAATGRMMMSEVRVVCVNPNHQGPIPYEALVCPICKAKQPEITDAKNSDRDGDGMPDEWEDDHRFNKYDPNDAFLDADGDGFSNVEEYAGGSNPNDFASSPSPSSKLRSTKIDTQVLKVLFVAASDREEGKRFQLNELNRNKTWFKFLGETAEGYSLSEYLPDAEEGPTLILRKGFEIIKLVKGKAALTQRRSANLISLIDGERWRGLFKGDTFEMQELTYNIVDITSSEIIIHDDSGEETRITRISKREAHILRQGGTGGPSSGRGTAGRERVAPGTRPFVPRR